MTTMIFGKAEINGWLSSGKPRRRIWPRRRWWLGSTASIMCSRPSLYTGVRCIATKPTICPSRTIYPYLMEVERLDGFDGPIKLQMADRQIKDLDGVEIVDTTIVPGQSQVMLPVFSRNDAHQCAGTLKRLFAGLRGIRGQRPEADVTRRFDHALHGSHSARDCETSRRRSRTARAATVVRCPLVLIDLAIFRFHAD